MEVEHVEAQRFKKEMQQMTLLVFVNKSEAKKHRTEWCATTNKYRCMRCRRRSTNMKDQSDCVRTGNTCCEDGAHHVWEDTTW